MRSREKTDIIDEERLSRECSRGDRNAQRVLYTEYAARAYALCFRYLGDKEEAKDLMHEAMLKVFGNIGKFSYRGKGSLWAWISRLTANMALDHLRKNSRLPLEPLPDNVAIEDEPVEENDIGLLTDEEILQSISILSPTKRAVFNMYCIDGFSHKEIGDKLGIGEKTSSSILSRARKELITYLRKLMESKQ